MEEKANQDMERLKILNDIYMNENQKIKLECVLLQYEYQVLLNEHQELLDKLNRNLVIRIYRKIKRIFKKR